MIPPCALAQSGSFLPRPRGVCVSRHNPGYTFIPPISFSSHCSLTTSQRPSLTPWRASRVHRSDTATSGSASEGGTPGAREMRARKVSGRLTATTPTTTTTTTTSSRSNSSRADFVCFPLRLRRHHTTNNVMSSRVYHVSPNSPRPDHPYPIAITPISARDTPPQITRKTCRTLDPSCPSTPRRRPHPQSPRRAQPRRPTCPYTQLSPQPTCSRANRSAAERGGWTSYRGKGARAKGWTRRRECGGASGLQGRVRVTVRA